MHGEPVIEVHNLEKRYGDKVILKGISFSVGKGEVFGIVGHSGAGKSTVLRCLNGLEHYQHGSVKVSGHDMASLSTNGKKDIQRTMGMVFQNFNLMASKNVFSNVAFPLEIWRVPQAERKDRVMELLSLVGLADRCNERITALSGGQKQRVGIARALALSPDILLCDEATSALDPKTTVSILDLLEDIRKRLNLTILVVTHQMEVVKRMCNRMLLLDKGITQGIGQTDELFLAPSDNLKRLIKDEFAVLPGGRNIRLWFPKEIAEEAVITRMARELNVDFSIVGGKLERYIDDVRGYLIINVSDETVGAVLAYLKEHNLYWEVMSDD